MQGVHKNMPKRCNSTRKLAHIFINMRHVKNATKWQKVYQESYRKIPKILQEKQNTQGGSDSKEGGVHDKKIKRTDKKQERPTLPGPNPHI